MNQELNNRYQFAQELTTMTYQSGIITFPGTDCCNMNIVPGLSLHKELALLVEAGVPPSEVLELATSAPAKWLGISNEVGAIQNGLIADLIVLNENPLEDIRNTQKIYAVIQNGRIID